MISFELHDEAFMDWIKGAEMSFVHMADTMKQVAENLRDEVQLITPWRTGKLSRSYKWTVLADNSRMHLIEVKMSALNERTGFDYAFVQHRGWHTNKNGTKVLYNRGGMETGFFNYKYYKYSGDIEKRYSNVGDHFHIGGSRYLYNAIINYKTSAFEIIEKDYLSLFEYGGIF